MSDSALLAYGLSRALILLPITIWLQWYYARYLSSWITHIITFITWSLSFSIVYVLPLDLIPENKDQGLVVVWKVIYWMSFGLCWVVVPLIQDFYANGAFTFKRRLISSVRFNVKFYLIAGVALLIFMIAKMIASRLTITEVGAFIMCLANTWGLLLLVLLMGYGLVEVPRNLWYSGNRNIALKRCHYKLSELHGKAIEQQDRLEQICNVVQALDRAVPSTSPLRFCVDKIVSNCPSVRSFEGMRIYPDGRAVEIVERLTKLRKVPYEAWSERDMEELNYLCIKASNAVRVLTADWEATIKKALDLEGIIAWQTSAAGSTTIPASVRHRSTLYQYYWRFSVFWSPVTTRIVAVICALSSVIMLWGELALVFPKNLSPLSHLLKATKHNYFISQTICLIYLFYLVWCTFYTLFRVRLSSFYFMDPRGHTNAVSILHNAAFMLRVLPALGYNFFAVLELKNTAFQHVIGTMKAIPFLGGSFNTYFPLVMCVFSACTLFNFFSKLLDFLNIPHFRYSESFDDEHIVEGRTLFEAEKRRRDLNPPVAVANSLNESQAELTTQLRSDVGSPSDNGSAVKYGAANVSTSGSSSSKIVRTTRGFKGGSLTDQLDAL